MSHSRGEKFNREFSDLLLIHCYLIIYKLFPELQHCGPLWVPSSHHTNCLLIYSLISNKKNLILRKKKNGKKEQGKRTSVTEEDRPPLAFLS